MLSMDYLTNREHIRGDRMINSIQMNYKMSRLLPDVLTESPVTLENTDKIFASEWLSEGHVIFGTKCSKLLVTSLDSGKLFSIPLLRNQSTKNAANSCGIHSISVSPREEFVATSGWSPNETAIYRFPTFDPLLIGQHHKDWIFSAKWLSDSVLVTGSRDSTMAVWSLPSSSDNYLAEEVPSTVPVHVLENIINPTMHDKVRDMVVSRQHSILGSLQASQCQASVYFWDTNVLQQTSVSKMQHGSENVCLALDEGRNLFAVGSRSYVTLIDPRAKHSGRSECQALYSPDAGNGVRSVEFNEGILSFGTGEGNLYFFDLRAGQYLSKYDASDTSVFSLKVSNGYLRHDGIYREFFQHVYDLRHAVYTHKYNPSKTKLFVAGGPLPLGLYGNYAAFWQ